MVSAGTVKVWVVRLPKLPSPVFHPILARKVRRYLAEKLKPMEGLVGISANDDETAIVFQEKWQATRCANIIAGDKSIVNERGFPEKLEPVEAEIDERAVKESEVRKENG